MQAAFRHEHILDSKNAPRGQLPYFLYLDKTIGDSDAIIAHLIARTALAIDDRLTASESWSFSCPGQTSWHIAGRSMPRWTGKLSLPL